jgi:hypothetical protein
VKKKTRAYRAPWYAQHFELLHLWVRALHAAPPPEKVEQELAAIFEEGDRRRAERNADTQATTDPVSTAARGRTRSEKQWLCALISRPFVGIPAGLTGAAAAVHAEAETSGARPATAVPAYDWREKQWLSDLIGRPFVGTVFTGAVAAMLAVGWGDYMPR